MNTGKALTNTSIRMLKPPIFYAAKKKKEKKKKDRASPPLANKPVC